MTFHEEVEFNLEHWEGGAQTVFSVEYTIG